MAGLNFQTCTILNSDKDVNGKAMWVAKGSTEYSFRVRRDFTFYKQDDEKGKVLSINKRAGYNPTMCKAVIALNGVSETSLADRLKVEGADETYCRLDVYLGVEGAEPYIYSTPWVLKGMPFWIEFTVKKDDNALTIAQNIVNAIKDSHVFQCDKDLINITFDGESPVITLTGATEYQRFRKVEIVRYNPKEDSSVLIADMCTEGDGKKPTGIYLAARGRNGFGTYSQLIKDLRLPTAAHTAWKNPQAEELPIPGAIYDQYIIDYEAPATNDGLHCVGQRMKSVTTHVFWVNHAIQSAFNTALTSTAGFSVTNNDVSPEEEFNGSPAMAAEVKQASPLKK